MPNTSTFGSSYNGPKRNYTNKLPTNSPLRDQYGPDIASFNKAIKPALQAQGLFDRNDIQYFDKFNTHGYLDPYNRMGTVFEYVFFTRPDLNIHNSQAEGTVNQDLSRYPIFAEAKSRWKRVFDELELSLNPSKPFSALLYNTRCGSLDLPDYDAGDEETSENMWGTKMYYRRSSITSSDNFDFSLEFRDNRWLDVYMYFRLWDAYEEAKSLGRVAPKDSYIYSKELHDQVAVYKFWVLEDGMTIFYWAKLVGVYPKNVPRNSFGQLPDDGDLKFTINFKANFVEDMDPNIIEDFNALASKYPGQVQSDWDGESGFGGGTSRFSNGPIITTEKSMYRTNTNRYLLRWK